MKRKLLLAWLVALVMSGCGQQDIRPATGEIAALEPAVESSSAGVTIVAQPGWIAEPDIASLVTPIRLIVENESGRPVRFRYGNLYLVDETGEIYPALPPFEIDAAFGQPLVAPHYQPFATPGFVYRDFEIASFYEPLYPRIPIFGRRFFFDPIFYERTYPYWTNTGLPTEDMLEAALPEGVLYQGGMVSGFTYFAPIPPETGELRLHMDLVDASSGFVFGAISMPLMP